MKSMKRLLALILVLVQVLSFPVEVAAAELFEPAEETVSQTLSDTEATSKSEPYLTFGQLDNWGEGWFENPDYEDHQGYDLLPGDDHRHIYYVRYQDENGDWHREPVHITASDNVTLTKIQDMEGETIREGEANAEYFYSVTTDSWDQETWVACQWKGRDLRFGINNSLIDGHFFYTPEYSNDAVIRHNYVMDPKAAENTFYFGFKSDYGTVVEVSQWDQNGNTMSGADLVTLNEGVTYDFCSRQEGFWIDLVVPMEDPDGNREQWYTGKGCTPGYMPYLRVHLTGRRRGDGSRCLRRESVLRG